MNNLEFDDDLDDLLSDPGFLNNHEKLMQMKVTEAELEEVQSTEWLDKLNTAIEGILQDTSVHEACEQLLESECGDPDSPQNVIEALMGNMMEHQQKCWQIITDMKNQPFWTNKNSETIFGSRGNDQVEKWMKVLDKFGKTFSQAKTLRMSRSSILPMEQKETDEIINVISNFKEILGELEMLSKGFEMDIRTSNCDDSDDGEII